MSMTKGDDTITFGYDAEGRRISKTVNGAKTRYFYIGDTVAGEESAANGKIAYIYDDAGRISSLRRTINGTTTTYHLLTNSRGDVEAIYRDDGTLIARYIYDAYGNEIKREYGESESHRGIASINPFRYRGYMYDSETGYYYLMSRYYNPTIGRFVNADTTEILNIQYNLYDKNLYSYCDSNPIVRKDVSGYLWDTAFDIISIVISLKEVAKNPRSMVSWIALAADIFCLIVPFASGGGLTVRALSKSDDVIDAAKTLYYSASKGSDLRKATGSYVIKFADNMVYVGKGGFKRAIDSAKKFGEKSKVVSIEWEKAPNAKEAFIAEYKKMCRYGGPKNPKNYNSIWSPGRKYFHQKYGRYYYYGGKKW